jgi:hypothetical protein
MGTSRRNDKADAILCAQLETGPGSKARGLRTQVHHHVEEPSTCAAHELGLAVGSLLVVQTTQRCGPGVA